MRQERRRLQRTNISKAAKIIFGTYVHSSIDCLVLDLTGSGAGIRFEECRPIPHNIELTFDAARTRRKCRVAWRSYDRLGLEFLKPPHRAAR
jgi:PilZ domain-containing protein